MTAVIQTTRTIYHAEFSEEITAEDIWQLIRARQPIVAAKLKSATRKPLLYAPREWTFNLDQVEAVSLPCV